LILLASSWVVAPLGCSSQSDVRDAGESVRSLVRVDLSYTRLVGGAEEPRFDAQAHFVRYTAAGSPREIDRSGVPTILGMADFEGMALDSCRVADGTADLDEALGDVPFAGAPTEVALLDAGRIEVRGPVDRAALLPHHYPELVPFVSGVVYGGNELQPVALGLGQPYQVTGEGGEEVGPFVASATAPRAFPGLTLEPYRRGSDLELRWGDPGEAMEPLLIEVRWSWRSGSRSVRCRVRDDGAYTVPHEVLASLPAQAVSATVTATRQQRGPLGAPGAGRGELTLSLRDQAPLQVTP
jgi:hypothetical protein